MSSETISADNVITRRRSHCEDPPEDDLDDGPVTRKRHQRLDSDSGANIQHLIQVLVLAELDVKSVSVTLKGSKCCDSPQCGISTVAGL